MPFMPVSCRASSACPDMRLELPPDARAPEPAARPDLRQRLAWYLHLVRWDRPAGWLLLLWPTLSALWLAAGGFPGWHLLLVFSLGTVLMRSAGCCINDVADRDVDRHVKRTAQRPVTSGRVSVREALLLGAALAALAFALVLSTNPVTIAWSFAALLVTIVYPYTKRFFSMPQAVLGVAFSFGIPMAFAAVGGGSLDWGDLWNSVPAWAWLLLVGNLFWVLAYDTEYAMADRDDDLLLGIKTSAITLGRFDVGFVGLCYALYLMLWAVVVAPRLAAPGGFLLAVVVAAAQAAWHVWLIRQRGREACFRAFRVNHWLGFTVFAGIVVSNLLD